jgi:NADH:ubiquinone reductase (non-electrogenic)
MNGTAEQRPHISSSPLWLFIAYVYSIQVPYDILVVSVGSINNTFGVPGVEENCMFFKSIEDARHLRARVSELFERAALPNTPREDLDRLLSFVVVGGGPTGVEVAAELHDMVTQASRVESLSLLLRSPFLSIFSVGRGLYRCSIFIG